MRLTVRVHALVGAALLACVPYAAAPAAELPGEPLAIEGAVVEADDISAVAFVGPLLLIGSDEGTSIQVLEPAGPHTYRVLKTHNLLPESKTEIDTEAMAASGNTVYVLGSHGGTRKSVASSPEKNDRKYAENRKRMEKLEHESSRENLFRLTVASSGAMADVKSVSLHDLLAADPILGAFTHIPSKENGVDIEGLAMDGKQLLLGFRGPVLRGNYVPVMLLPFERPAAYELRFVNLNGLGIRELVKVSDGFLVIAGAVGDAPGANLLYHWDGRDMLPGTDVKAGQVRLLGSFPAHVKGNAEGLAVERETEAGYDLVVAFDGGRPPLYQFHVPRSAGP